MKAITSAFFIGLLFAFSSACDSSNENTETTIVEETAISVKTSPVTIQDLDISKTYFGQVNFKQSTTIMAEMPGTVQQVKWKVGQSVRQGQSMLIYPRPDDNLDIENKDYDQAKIAYDELKKNYDRQLVLFEKGAVNKVSVEQLQSQMEVQKKVMEQLQLNIKKSYSIKAPYSGIITDVHVQTGQQVAPGTPLFSIAKNNQLEIEFFVLPKDFDAIHVGKKVQIINEQDSISAKISEKAFAMDRIRRAFRVAVTLGNTNQGIYAGSTVKVNLIQKTIKRAIVLPEETIHHSGGEHFVYVAKENNAIVKKVVLGQRTGLDVIVNEGIEEGDLLITAGMDKLKNNTPISIIQ